MRNIVANLVFSSCLLGRTEQDKLLYSDDNRGESKSSSHNSAGGLQDIYKTPINYEEVAYENAADLDVIVRSGPTGVIQRLAPRKGSLTVAIGQTEIASAMLGIEAALKAHVLSGLGGQYQVTQGFRGFSVLPTQLLAVSGLPKTVTPVMSQKISFPIASRTPEETLDIFLTQLQAAAGAKILLGAINMPEDRKISMGASGETASDILQKLTSVSFWAPNFYWLLYEPQQKAYYLSFVPVHGFQLSGADTTQAQPAKIPREENSTDGLEELGCWFVPARDNASLWCDPNSNHYC